MATDDETTPLPGNLCILGDARERLAMTTGAASNQRDGDLRLAQSFDLTKVTPAFLDDPYPTYRALREHDPIHALADGSYFLSRYGDLVAVYRDPAAFSSDKTVDFRPKFGDSALYEHHTTSLVFNDPPYHTRVRRLLMPFFTQATLRKLVPRVEALVEGLLDDAQERGEVDLIADLAAALPINLIGDLLGVPRDERGPLRQWSLDILGALEPSLSDDQVKQGCAAVDDFKTYLRDLIARRRREPADQDEPEILSTLIADHDSGDGLSEVELLHNCIFVLNAGHETTTNLIGNGVDALMRFPDQCDRLRGNPDLIDGAIEEFLRFESPVQIGNRKLTRAVEFGGVTLAAGTYVHLGIAAANRDAAEFVDSHRLDIARAPNRHLAFGSGIHACAGLSVARLEGRVAIGRLVRRFRRIEPAGVATRAGRARFRGFFKLPVSLGR